ncbi:class I SAM-dependent methyltransferase [Methyloceanibacter sp. wino2]|uniref:class I SAM-dependent methyltransferase n=1 Tax=Methyloceanibacter sp. wino2 TaxID=2170729 RepID=UPI00131EE0A7|nr:class I SAM-dependent methyltransferase [Methyloceanibacter sp. wino2]
MKEAFWAHGGLLCDKWEQYLPVYESELGPRIERGAPLSLLEIGVQNGGSLELWLKVLPPNSHVVGIDVDSRCRELRFSDGIEIHIGDATQLEFVTSALGERRFDVIIDDGSHLARDVITSFDILFERLKPGGVYIIEDMHTSYWPDYGGGFRLRGAPIEWAKDLIDALNVDHFEESPRLPQDELARLQALGTQIARLAFFDSMLVVQKHSTVKGRPFSRLLTGSEFPISDPMNWVPRLPPEKSANLLIGPAVARHLDSGIKKLVEERGAAIQRQEQEIQRREQEIKRQRSEIQRQGLEIERQVLKIAREERRNKALLTSSSWKVTAPLRKAAALVKSARNRLSRFIGRS